MVEPIEQPGEIPDDMSIEHLRWIVARRRDNLRRVMKHRHEMSPELFEWFHALVDKAEKALRAREAMLEAKDAPKQ